MTTTEKLAAALTKSDQDQEQSTDTVFTRMDAEKLTKDLEQSIDAPTETMASK